MDKAAGDLRTLPYICIIQHQANSCLASAAAETRAGTVLRPCEPRVQMTPSVKVTKIRPEHKTWRDFFQDDYDTSPIPKMSLS